FRRCLCRGPLGTIGLACGCLLVGPRFLRKAARFCSCSLGRMMDLGRWLLFLCFLTPARMPALHAERAPHRRPLVYSYLCLRGDNFMKTSTERILTTHVGSLPRPQDVVDFLFAQDRGETYDPSKMEDAVRAAVEGVTESQKEA